jgi:Co/Zn/Cd efflux system component
MSSQCGHDHNHHHHHHHHGKCRFFRTKTFRLLSMLSLTFGYFVVELVVGNITKSVALMADAFHMLSDVISLVIGIVAVRAVKHRSDVNTYGWVRAEVVGANVNTVFLLALCLTIVFDAIKRFIEPEPIENVNLLLIVGSVGLGINIIGLFLFQGFHGHSHGGTKTKPNENIQTDEHNDNVNRFERHSTRALQEVRFSKILLIYLSIEFRSLRTVLINQTQWLRSKKRMIMKRKLYQKRKHR